MYHHIKFWKITHVMVFQIQAVNSWMMAIETATDLGFHYMLATTVDCCNISPELTQSGRWLSRRRNSTIPDMETP